MPKCKFLAAIALAAIAVFIAPLVGARSLWMSGEEIVAAFHDATIEGRYSGGRPFTETYRADGRIEYLDGGRTMGGRWSVTEGTLCTIYDTDPTGGCFRVAKVGSNCFEFYFVSRTEEAAPGKDGDPPEWTARGALAGKTEACPDGANA